jgi:hypothetical protein
MCHKHPAVRCLLSYANRAIRTGTAPVADTVIVDKGMLLSKARFRQQRSKPIGEGPGVHQQDWFPRTANLVLQHYAIESRALHALCHYRLQAPH